MNRYFPQINRKITALFSCLLWGVLLIVTLLNYHTQLFPENEQLTKLKLQTLKKPTNYLAYINLGLYLDKHGLTKEALANFQIAQTFYNFYGDSRFDSNRVLGEQTSPFSIYQELLSQRQKIDQEVEYWNQVTIEKPQYRDAYLQLGIGYYRLGLIEKTKESFLKAFTIDPFYPYKDQFKF